VYKLMIPENYKSLLTLKETEIAIKKVKDYFEKDLALKLGLVRVSAPLFVDKNSGMNDTLNGTERPVTFDIKDTGADMEIVHSLAKWKRDALGRYGFNRGEGLYTDMNAIRRDEDLDNIHSVFVDQWDWEKVIEKSDRNEKTLKDTVNAVYSALKSTEDYIAKEYDFITPILPESIFFITTEELLNMYPDLTAKERENEIAKKHGAVFIMQIGGDLSNGTPHDGRAPDYDDWSLNGDIIVYYPVLDIALELSSMGIRVDEEALLKQLEIRKVSERVSLPFHKALLDGKLPYTIGGGIGQSRMCMFFLKKAHIGEVQSSFWPEKMIKECKENKIEIL